MTLLTRGAGLRRMAQAGFERNAALEARENQVDSQIDQAKQAQKSTTIGGGAGIGAMYGLKQAGAAKAASAVTQEAATSALVDAAAAEALVLEAGGTAAAAGEASSAVMASAGAPVATGSASTLSTIASFAGPIAIGLGAAFLISELFD